MDVGMLKKYLEDTSGNFAATFAVGILMLLAGVGAAVDYNSMTSRRATYQNISDAAVLAAVRTGSTDPAELLVAAKAVVAEHNTMGDSLTTTLTFEGDNKVQVHIAGTYDTVLMGMFGTSNSDVRVVSESLLGVNGYINLVLVLDGTASMGYNSRLTNMKAAATQMITDLEDFEDDRLKISVVPFSQYVNVGVENRSKPWVDVPPDWTEYFSEVCYTNTPVTGTVPGSCSTTSYPPSPPTTCSNDGVSYSCGGSSGGTTTSCSYTYGPPVTTCSTPDPVVHTWHGIVGSRNNPHHKRVGYSSNKKIPGFLDTTGNVSMLPLTSNLGTVKSKIASVTSVGNTYMPAGLMWGWRALNPGAPFTEASASPADKVRNVMVFMTDGYNTISITGNTHDGTDRNEADNMTEEMCTKIKAAEIEVYSITYEVMDSASRTLVRNCATDNTMYYDAANGSQLSKAFKDIGRSILSPRLTH